MTTEAKVGAFVLGCFAVLAFTVIYLLNAQYSGGTVHYRTYLRYAGGLEPGASVLYGGMNVGKVTAVRPSAADPTRIEILLDVKKDTPLNEKSVAKLGFVSVMNSAALSITTGTIDAKRLPPESTVASQEAASLDEIAGKLATVADSANTLITQAQGELNSVSGNVNHLLANLDTITGSRNQKQVQAILDNIDRLVADERPKIDRLTDQLSKVSEHADDTIQNVNGTVTDLRAPVQKDLAELQVTLEQAKGLAAVDAGHCASQRLQDRRHGRESARGDRQPQSVHEFTKATSLEPCSRETTRGAPGSEIGQERRIEMKKLLNALALMLVIITALTGCGGKLRYPAYYTLNLPAPPDPPAPENVRTSIAVREFQSPNYLRQGPIVYRTTPEEIGFYEYHRWAADPRTLLTSAVIDHLRASGQYSLVSRYDGRPNNDYVFSGKLEKLEEVDYEAGVKVEVAMSAQITKVATGATVWSNDVSETRPVSQRNVPGVVSELNRTVDLAVNKLLSTVPAPLASER